MIFDLNLDTLNASIMQLREHDLSLPLNNLVPSVPAPETISYSLNGRHRIARPPMRFFSLMIEMGSQPMPTLALNR